MIDYMTRDIMTTDGSLRIRIGLNDKASEGTWEWIADGSATK